MSQTAAPKRLFTPVTGSVWSVPAPPGSLIGVMCVDHLVTSPMTTAAHPEIRLTSMVIFRRADTEGFQGHGGRFIPHTLRAD